MNVKMCVGGSRTISRFSTSHHVCCRAPTQVTSLGDSTFAHGATLLALYLTFSSGSFQESRDHLQDLPVFAFLVWGLEMCDVMFGFYQGPRVGGILALLIDPSSWPLVFVSACLLRHGFYV